MRTRYGWSELSSPPEPSPERSDVSDAMRRLWARREREDQEIAALRAELSAEASAVRQAELAALERANTYAGGGTLSRRRRRG